jgi:hypothetical protein
LQVFVYFSVFIIFHLGMKILVHAIQDPFKALPDLTLLPVPDYLPPLWHAKYSHGKSLLVPRRQHTSVSFFLLFASIAVQFLSTWIVILEASAQVMLLLRSFLL